MEQVNWSASMLCIRGPRGVGKSTLLRQYIKSHFEEGSEEVLYCSLDWVYFSQHSILEVAEKFYKHGGRLLILDEVHKYEGWSREVKEVAETYPQLQLRWSTAKNKGTSRLMGSGHSRSVERRSHLVK